MSYQEQYNRILSIQWRYDDSRLNSGAKLALEYLRRIAEWHKALRAAEDWPFFSVVQEIDKSIRIENRTRDEIENRLDEAGVQTFYVHRILVWQLEWALAYTKGITESLPFALPDPYEPLIRMFERGQVLSTEHGFILVNSRGGIPIVGAERHVAREPLLALDDESLDRVDESPSQESSSAQKESG